MAKSNNRKFRVVWMFEARDLVKTFGSVVAVNKVSFTIDKPQMIGIIGRSGAGKSTLLRMINRLETATSGQIIADGVDVTALHGRSKRDWQRNCAMIFQQFNLVPYLSLVENVLLPCQFCTRRNGDRVGDGQFQSGNRQYRLRHE